MHVRTEDRNRKSSRNFLTITVALCICAEGVRYLIAGYVDVRGYLEFTVWLLILFTAATLVCSVTESILRAHRHTDDETRQVDVGALLRTVRRPDRDSFLLIAAASIGIWGSTSLAEVYRLSFGIWNDSTLWSIEQVLLQIIVRSGVNEPRLWDLVYQMVWPVLAACVIALAQTRRNRELAILLCSLVIAYHLTRYVSILFPTAGPMFHKAELFRIDGTISAELARILKDYMRGKISAQGYPGTQAFPSLHVAMAWGVLVVMAWTWRWSVWVLLPWFVLNWFSTLALGWHYMLDGVGGILLMNLSLVISRRLMTAPETWEIIARRPTR
jgi:membrane-associated phospholipid phosphatase